MSRSERVAVYCIASPLHYLAAQCVARDHERGARHVLVCYRPSLAPLIRPDAWDAVVVIAWPRVAPLPGPFGRHRRLLANLDAVARAVGRCRTLHLHAPVFDTEVVNYFVRGLPPLTGATTLRARLLPDGVLNVKRHVLPVHRRAAQWIRKLRRLASPRLDYARFSGCRTGADAPFVDRIYVLPGFPHRYEAAKVVRLVPLVAASARDEAQGVRRALVLGQPLVGVGVWSDDDAEQVAAAIDAWLESLGIVEVDYKAHPRDGGRREMARPRYRDLTLDEPVESWLARQRYDAIVGCCSTTLFIARQMFDARTRVAAFGLDRCRFADAQTEEGIVGLIDALGIERYGGDGAAVRANNSS